jgi:hypothetical protein
VPAHGLEIIPSSPFSQPFCVQPAAPISANFIRAMALLLK